jgi:hypothetical protein
MNGKTVRCEEPTEGSYIRLPVPLGDTDAFRYGATADILHLLVDNPERGLSSVNAAGDTLEALGVITVDRSGRANAVRVTYARRERRSLSVDSRSDH